jgi:hypothetical protein
MARDPADRAAIDPAAVLDLLTTSILVVDTRAADDHVPGHRGRPRRLRLRFRGLADAAAALDAVSD